VSQRRAILSDIWTLIQSGFLLEASGNQSRSGLSRFLPLFATPTLDSFKKSSLLRVGQIRDNVEMLKPYIEYKENFHLWFKIGATIYSHA